MHQKSMRPWVWVVWGLSGSGVFADEILRRCFHLGANAKQFVGILPCTWVFLWALAGVIIMAIAHDGGPAWQTIRARKENWRSEEERFAKLRERVRDARKR